MVGAGEDNDDYGGDASEDEEGEKVFSEGVADVADEVFAEVIDATTLCRSRANVN